jgi:hypothetical protein
MKAMTVGMVFMLIFTVVVIGFITFFGFQAITDFFCLSGDAQVQKSYNNIEDAVESLYTKTRGSSQTISVNIPSSTRICFVNSSDPGPNILGGWLPDPDLEDIIRVKGYSTWITLCRGGEGYIMDHIRVEKSFCIISSGEVYIQNMGRYVDIEIMS